MGSICFQLEQIPDLSLNKYQSLADTGIDGVLKRHENFLRQWHGICGECGVSFHLLYCYIPSEAQGHQLKVFFIIKGEETAISLLKPILKKSPLSDFFVFTESTLPMMKFNAGATLTKKERVADIYNPMTGQSRMVHYVPKWEINERGRLYDLFRMLETIGQAYQPKRSCAFRIDVYPVAMEQITRNAFQPVLKELRGENDIKLMRETDSLRLDSYARDICREYENWLTDIETTPHFQVNIYSFAEDIFQTKIILNAAGAECLEEGDFSIAPIKEDSDGKFNLYSRMKEKEDYCFYPGNSVLKSWSTTFCLPEISPFFRFPTLFDGEVIQIPKETAPIQCEHGIYMGKDTNGYDVNIPIKDFTKHAFFTGMPGAGKTNSMLHLATQLKKNRIPFLVMEPAKKEYRALLKNREMQDVYLFSPHLQSKFPLHMNPMEFPKGVRLSEHINALLDVFRGSFVLEGPTYKFLSSAIQRSYENLEWNIEDENNGLMRYPTLQDVYNNLESEIDSSSYDTEIKGNVRAFLQVRLGGLMERDAGELFNVPLSTFGPEQWIERSAIVELEVLGEQEKNFFVLMVCHYILETIRANPTGGIDKNGELMPVRHAIFIEEAHNIIASSQEQSNSESVDPKISATAYIVKMLAEVRALREAIIIADQLPTALTAEVTKNTGLKVVHRLTSKDDREEIGTAISATPRQLERMASFSSGQAFIYHEKTLKPFEMQIAEWVVPKVNYDYTNDTQLYNELSLLGTMICAVECSFENWKYQILRIENELEEVEKSLSNNDSMQRKSKQFFFQTKLSCLKKECKGLVRKYQRLYELWISEKDKRHPLYNDFEETALYLNGISERLEGCSNYINGKWLRES